MTRKIIAGLLLACFVFALPVQGQNNAFSAAALQAWKTSITPNGFMGAPRYTTALLPTCTTNNNRGALAYDTTLSSLVVCSGSAWATTGGGGASTLGFNDDVQATFGTGTDFSLEYDTAQTPDSMVLGVSADSLGLIIAEKADANFDWAHALAVDPTLFIHSHNQSTTQWLSLKHDGTNGVITTGAGALSLSGASGNSALTLPSAGGMTLSALNAGIFTINTGTGSPFPRIYMGNTAKALTESSATAFIQVGVPANSHTGVIIDYTIVADDGTEYQSRTGMIVVAAVSKGSTETCTVSTVTTAVEVVALSSGTLTNTFACDTAPTNAINITANAVSSLTQTTLSINYQVRKNGGLGSLTAQ